MAKQHHPEPVPADRRDILLDVSRLIWRAWAGKLPTGVDRVCLAYLDHFAHRSLAVVQRKGRRRILSASASDRLFRLLLMGRSASPIGWVRTALAGLPALFRSAPARPGMIYLNVGHTGLDDPGLSDWIAANRLRAIFMVHDLIPLTHPQFCRDGEADRHAKRMETVLTGASGVIGNSQATIDELKRFAGSRGLAVPPTLAAHIAGHQPQGETGRGPAPKPYYVTLGTIEGRKNHQLLLRVWQRLIGQLGAAAPDLLIVGQRGWKAEEVIRQLDDLGPLAGFVHERGDYDDAELAQALAGARALLMPSFTEGFGLPIIEALQMSVPVIASDLPVYRELADDIPTYLDPADEEGWEAMIRAFLGESEERQRQLAAMPGFRPPSWSDHFRRVEAWLPTIG